MSEYDAQEADMSRPISDADMVETANELLAAVGGAGRRIESLEELQASASSLFVAVFESVFEVELIKVRREHLSDDDLAANAQEVVDATQGWLQETIPEHVTGAAIAGGDVSAITYMLALFAQMLQSRVAGAEGGPEAEGSFDYGQGAGGAPGGEAEEAGWAGEDGGEEGRRWAGEGGRRGDERWDGEAGGGDREARYGGDRGYVGGGEHDSGYVGEGGYGGGEDAARHGGGGYGDGYGEGGDEKEAAAAWAAPDAARAAPAPSRKRRVKKRSTKTGGKAGSRPARAGKERAARKPAAAAAAAPGTSQPRRRAARPASAAGARRPKRRHVGASRRRPAAEAAAHDGSAAGPERGHAEASRGWSPGSGDPTSRLSSDGRPMTAVGRRRGDPPPADGLGLPRTATGPNPGSAGGVGSEDAGTFAGEVASPERAAPRPAVPSPATSELESAFGRALRSPNGVDLWSAGERAAEPPSRGRGRRPDADSPLMQPRLLRQPEAAPPGSSPQSDASRPAWMVEDVEGEEEEEEEELRRASPRSPSGGGQRGGEGGDDEDGSHWREVDRGAWAPSGSPLPPGAAAAEGPAGLGRRGRSGGASGRGSHLHRDGAQAAAPAGSSYGRLGSDPLRALPQAAAALVRRTVQVRSLELESLRRAQAGAMRRRRAAQRLAAAKMRQRLDLHAKGRERLRRTEIIRTRALMDSVARSAVSRRMARDSKQEVLVTAMMRRLAEEQRLEAAEAGREAAAVERARAHAAAGALAQARDAAMMRDAFAAELRVGEETERAAAAIGTREALLRGVAELRAAESSALEQGEEVAQAAEAAWLAAAVEPLDVRPEHGRAGLPHRIDDALEQSLDAARALAEQRRWAAGRGAEATAEEQEVEMAARAMAAAAAATGDPAGNAASSGRAKASRRRAASGSKARPSGRRRARPASAQPKWQAPMSRPGWNGRGATFFNRTMGGGGSPSRSAFV